MHKLVVDRPPAWCSARSALPLLAIVAVTGFQAMPLLVGRCDMPSRQFILLHITSRLFGFIGCSRDFVSGTLQLAAAAACTSSTCGAAAPKGRCVQPYGVHAVNF